MEIIKIKGQHLMDIKECTQEYWDVFVDSSPQGTVFNKSFVLGSYGLPVKYLICHKGDESVAGFAFAESPNGIEMRNYSYLNGIIFKNFDGLTQYRVNETVFQALEAFALYLFNRYEEVSFTNHWDISAMRAFDWINYHERDKGYYQMFPRYTSLLDISHPESTDGYAHKRRIPELKKGIKEGRIFETRPTADIDLLNRLVDMNFQRQAIERTEVERRDLKNICKNLLENRSAKLLATYTDGQPAVITCFAYDKRRAYYLFVGTDLSLRDWGIGTKNIYEACIILHRDLGLNELDMVGVNSPLRGSYKLSFGGRLVPYFLIQKIPPRR